MKGPKLAIAKMGFIIGHGAMKMMQRRSESWSLVVSLVVVMVLATTQCCALSSDGEALLDVKSSLVDHHGVLASWNASDSFPCQWEGVYCRNSSQPRVWDLDLSSRNLSGSISPSIGSLAALRYLNLSNNQLSGSIPNSITNLSKLADRKSVV